MSRSSCCAPTSAATRRSRADSAARRSRPPSLNSPVDRCRLRHRRRHDQRRVDAVHRHGVRRRPDPARCARYRRPAAAATRARDHRGGLRRARAGARGRDRAPRHQAGQRDADHHRRRQGDGLRDRPGADRVVGDDDPDRGRRRHRALPLARAGARRARRCPQRHLLDRLPALRVADRRTAVHRRDRRRGCLPTRTGGPDPAVHRRAGRACRRPTRSCWWRCRRTR